VYVGKYKLLKTIGKGNFAKVKLARHIPTGQEATRWPRATPTSIIISGKGDGY
jgi:serine/threonine protein kinase